MKYICVELTSCLLSLFAAIRDKYVTMNVTRSDIGQDLAKVVVSLLHSSNEMERLTINLIINSSVASYTCPGDVFPADIKIGHGNVTFRDECAYMELIIIIPPTVQITFSLTVQSSGRGIKTYGPFIIGTERKYSIVVSCWLVHWKLHE